MPAKFTPMPNTGSQIERAVLALLQDAYGEELAANYKFIFTNCGIQRAVPYIEVIAKRSVIEPPHTGNHSFTVEIEWKYDGSPQETANWREINEFVGIGQSALSQTEANAGDPNTLSDTVRAEINRLGRALAVSDPDHHADMADFTCLYLEHKGDIRAESSGDTFYIVEKKVFEIRACSANVD